MHNMSTRSLYLSVCLSAGYEQRLRELCKDLLGPVHKSSSSAWESTVLVSLLEEEKQRHRLVKDKNSSPVRTWKI